jgi:hypothetical protein
MMEEVKPCALVQHHSTKCVECNQFFNDASVQAEYICLEHDSSACKYCVANLVKAEEQASKLIDVILKKDEAFKEIYKIATSLSGSPRVASICERALKFGTELVNQKIS